jgi:hypothetical protein
MFHGFVRYCLNCCKHAGSNFKRNNGRQLYCFHLCIRHLTTAKNLQLKFSGLAKRYKVYWTVQRNDWKALEKIHLDKWNGMERVALSRAAFVNTQEQLKEFSIVDRHTQLTFCRRYEQAYNYVLPLFHPIAPT